MSSRVRRVAWPVGLMAVAMSSCIGMCVGFPCFPTGIRYGLWVDQCPATDMRLGASLTASHLVRGDDDGLIVVQPWAQWLTSDKHWGWLEQGDLQRGFTTRFELRRGDEPVPGLVVTSRDGSSVAYRATLPELPDGDYTLVGTVDAGFDQAEVTVPLAMYAPAIVHLASDRPLYKPGQTVHLRSAVLRRSDGAPLDERPGRWFVRAPDGTEMLVEKAEGGPWGVSATTFPLSDDAAHGRWTARYVSGNDSDQIGFDVRPFQLPRMSVEAKGAERWFGIGDTITLSGRVTYASGAPVRSAQLTVQVRVAEGRWPMPLVWEEPLEAVTLPDGTFEVEVGEVPADLLDRTVLSASVVAVDETGESVVGGTSLVLSVDDLQVEAVTELGDGLVQGFNNRAYVRATTPDGRPLPKVELTLSRPYDPAASSITATTDVDGVAAVQIDPGAPVTVVEPAPPVRLRPLTPDEPRLLSAQELGEDRALDLVERRAIDRVQGAVADCGVYAVGSAPVTLGLRVAESGVPTVTVVGDDVLSGCVARVARGLRFPAGEVRTYSLRWQVPDALRPSLRWGHRIAVGTQPRGLPAALEQAGLRARRCFQRGQGIDGAAVVEVHWSASETGQLVASVVPSPGTGLSPAAMACVRSELASVRRVDNGSEAPAAGVSFANLSVPRPPGQSAPRATTRTAYELGVAAARGDDALGETRLVVGVGSIPALRMRATPSLAVPGDTVEVALYRGPSFRGELPETLWLQHEGRSVTSAKVVDNKAVFTVPSDVEGFVEVSSHGARAVIYVAPAAPLGVALTTDRAVYRPGEEATLTVTTTAGEEGQPAAVLLSGVDQSLGQLAPLLAPDDFGRVTVKATSPRPAFGSFDAKALTLGRVRGDNAAQAAVLRVEQLGQGGAHGIGAVSGSQRREPAVEEVLSTSFYRALEATVRGVRAWEASAPEGETMQPKTMVRLWNEALAGLKAAGEPAVDAYGRSLSLGLLPAELLEQVDPRVVVADGTRLPEDIVSWTLYVSEEVR